MADLIQAPAEIESGAPQGPQQVNDAEGFDALEPGTVFLDQAGRRRQKPYAPKSAEEFWDIPDNSHFLDPEGNVQQKPRYKSLDYTAQTLYDMAVNDRERRRVLEGHYGKDTVKEYGGQMFIRTPDGRFYRPGATPGSLGSAMKQAGAAVTSEAAPALLSGAGAVGGGLVAGPAGAISGAGLGGATGRGINDIILALNGYYDRGVGEEFETLGKDFLGGAIGEGAGRLVVKTAKGVGTLARFADDVARGDFDIRSAGDVAGKVVGRFLGADPEATQRAADLAAQGVIVPPSAWAHESPYIQTVAETFDPAFRTQDVLGQSRSAYHSKAAKEIADQLGISEEQAGKYLQSHSARELYDDSIAKQLESGELSEIDTREAKRATKRDVKRIAEVPVDPKEAGDMMITRVHNEMMDSDAALAKSMEDSRTSAISQAESANVVHEANLNRMQQDVERNRGLASEALDQTYEKIEQEIKQIIQDTKTGARPGDATRRTAALFSGARQGVRTRSDIYYGAADAAAGDVRPYLGTLADDAGSFLQSLPEPFQAKHPDIVKRLAALESGETTWGQLHQLRSMIRQDIDYGDLSSTQKNGILKYFESKLDDVIHGGPSKAGFGDKGDYTDYRTRMAAKLLDGADSFYAREMPKFRNKVIQGVVDQLDDGMPADATKLAELILQPGYTERIRTVRGIVGENMWSAVRAADTQNMLNASKLRGGGYDAKEFAKQVDDRVQNGLLEEVYDKGTAAQLKQQAERVLMVEGTIKDLTPFPDDTVASYLRRANAVADEMKRLAEADPMRALETSLKDIDKKYAGDVASLKQDRNSDNLSFLYGANPMAITSANKILANPDYLVAAAKKFGTDSDEWKALQQVGVLRILQNPSLIKDKFETEINLLFPGVAAKDLRTLAENLDFLAPSASGTGGSIAARSRVLHPTGSLIFGLGNALKPSIPGADAVARQILGTTYRMITEYSTDPARLAWLARSLRGTAPERDEARQEFWRLANKYSRGVGGATGTVYEDESQKEPLRATTTPEPRKSWREDARAK